MVDGQAIATVGSGRPALAATNFNLVRSEGVVSQHQMSVAVSQGSTAAGVLLLLYDKPGS